VAKLIIFFIFSHNITDCIRQNINPGLTKESPLKGNFENMKKDSSLLRLLADSLRMTDSCDNGEVGEGDPSFRSASFGCTRIFLLAFRSK
jgi:hypothetical protein